MLKNRNITSFTLSKVHSFPSSPWMACLTSIYCGAMCSSQTPLWGVSQLGPCEAVWASLSNNLTVPEVLLVSDFLRGSKRPVDGARVTVHGGPTGTRCKSASSAIYITMTSSPSTTHSARCLAAIIRTIHQALKRKLPHVRLVEAQEHYTRWMPSLKTASRSA